MTNNNTNHQHYWQYESTEVDDVEFLWPIQHWYRCLVCKIMKGLKP